MGHDLDTALTGISGILVTPYDTRGEVARDRLAPIIDRALGAGMHIPVVNGNTGEFYALTTDEACTMAATVVGMVGDRAPVLAGIGRGIRDACRLARVSADAGAAALMVHQPPDPFVAPRGIVDYLHAINDASGGLPMMLYLPRLPPACGSCLVISLSMQGPVTMIAWIELYTCWTYLRKARPRHGITRT